MRIATNTPASFYGADHSFVQLGDEIENTDIIILMLEKNWGILGIDKIKALAHWVSSYPPHVPCYIVGCESTIPDENIFKYRHEGRDAAVRALCDEILIRSGLIGVRGEITFTYLTQMMGYDASRVQIVYDPNALTQCRQMLTSFLDLTNIPKDLMEYLLSFQVKPSVLYERPIGYCKEIRVSEPYVAWTKSSARLSADVSIDGQIKTLWCETSVEYKDYLLSERSDAFLAVLLPLAMRSGKDLTFEAPITEEFLHNIEEVLIPHLCAHDPRLYETKIIADTDAAPLKNGGAIATGMSCGVDSFYTASLYYQSKYKAMNLTHLYCGNYLYGNDNLVFKRAQETADEMGLPLVRTATNINEELRLPHLYTHFFKIMFGVLALKKLFSTYYYSTAYDFSHFTLKDNSTNDTAALELLLLYVFTGSDLRIATGGAKSERLDKTRGIVDFPAARKFLNVCLDPHAEVNCGRCGKCRRTLLMLDYLGKLENFRGVFDLDEYQRTRLDSFIYLCSQKDTPIMSEVYHCFEVEEPALIRDATEIVEMAKLGNQEAKLRVNRSLNPAIK
ncbi:hypothetical protein N7379_15465 [Rhizobium pusense]|uniref:hypothetical protein n=1 Tax=Agrobacterium pusense TaxID=648995 RepID=UPI0024477600|nr:hypothetical protein [Agrobacterium pusense]MDH0115885.1 hypothetical protein [Agrobacterium pusense]